MLAAHSRSTNAMMMGNVAIKADAPFQCPACRNEVTLRKGLVKVHHFAHKSPHDKLCEHGRGEKDEHRFAKLAIYEALRRSPTVTAVQIELPCQSRCPDVLFTTAAGAIAVEVIASGLNEEQLCQRTNDYYQIGVPVAWVLPYRQELKTQRMSVRTYEKWLHALYFGRVYYHVRDDIVTPVHFGKVTTYVEATEYGGGYSKQLKAYVNPVSGPEQVLATCFRERLKDAWQGGRDGRFSLPRARLAMGQESQFWSV